MEERLLILALRGRDAAVIAQTVSKAGYEYLVCEDCDVFTAELKRGGGAAVITEESLQECDTDVLARWLADQPPWSDFPFILLATKRTGRRPRDAQALLDMLGNVVVLERPIHSETICSATASALRGRRRQYEARRHLESLSHAEDSLRALNANLETRIEERTRELGRANNRLMQEMVEREKAQEALVQSQKMEAVGQLTGGIAHDFNNLLTVISGNLELIQRRTGDERVPTWAGHGLQATQRAAKLTRQLLAFSRTQKLSLTAVDINALIGNMHELLLRSIGAEYELTLQLDRSAPWAMADVNQLELAILNLALNARDAMPAGGKLRIESATCSPVDGSLPKGRYTVIRVVDNGSGIPEHLLSRIFDPFFTTKPMGKGTGLGLSQVYGIAHQSGGKARVESRVGEGATVEIWLPHVEPQRAAELPAARAVHGNGANHHAVLVIEDDPGVRRFIVECLQTLGYAVVEAACGQDGIERLAARTPDLIIVDYAMPGMNGLEVIQAARATLPDLPILLATGYADMDAVSKVVDQEHVLRKPFQILDLERAIAHVMA